MSDPDADGLAALADGSYHVGWAALGIVGIGAIIVLGIAGGAVGLLLGVVLLVVGTGIFVDTWAHQYWH